jgi:ABC-type phosphate/phosphonate transport system substrate-binding protein
MGVLVTNSEGAAVEQYESLVDYLSEETGRSFELVTLNFTSQFGTVKEGSLDFIVTNPLASVQLNRLYDIQYLATFSRPKTGTQFGGIIVAKADSDIQTVDDLAGKRGACVAFLTAAGGCLFQRQFLEERGFDPFDKFESFEEIPSQNDIVLAVRDGTIDVGFVRTGQLEKMVKDGLIESADAFRIIEPAKDNFAQPHTTELYPEWPISSLKTTEPELVESVKQALVSLPSSDPALTALNLEKFVPPVDYSQFDSLIESMELVSWDAK